MTEVKQYQSEPECNPVGTGIVCTVERWRVGGYTDTAEYELACWELSQTDKEGRTISNVNCYPMDVGADIEVQIFLSAIAYPPHSAGKDIPNYAWYMVQSAKERSTENSK